MRPGFLKVLGTVHYQKAALSIRIMYSSLTEYRNDTEMKFLETEMKLYLKQFTFK